MVGPQGGNATRDGPLAAGQPAEGVNVGEMAAHITHPIWKAISRFGNPYPVYDFNSGMGDKILRLDEAKRLGVTSRRQRSRKPRQRR